MYTLLSRSLALICMKSIVCTTLYCYAKFKGMRNFEAFQIQLFCIKGNYWQDLIKILRQVKLWGRWQNMLTSERMVRFSSFFCPRHRQNLTEILRQVWYGMVWGKWPNMLTSKPMVRFSSSFFTTLLAGPN